MSFPSPPAPEFNPEPLGNGSYDPLTDGLLLIRYMFGVTGDALTTNALGPGATRRTGPEISNYLFTHYPQLDADGNNHLDALTDGVLILRYLFGLRGTQLVQGAVGTDATRSTAPDIERYLATLMP